MDRLSLLSLGLVFRLSVRVLSVTQEALYLSCEMTGECDKVTASHFGRFFQGLVGFSTQSRRHNGGARSSDISTRVPWAVRWSGTDIKGQPPPRTVTALLPFLGGDVDPRYLHPFLRAHRRALHLILPDD